MLSRRAAGMERPPPIVYHPCVIFRRYGTFVGGIDLPDEKQATLALPIGRCVAPDRLRVPLDPCGSGPAALVVRPNERVEAGRKIAEPADKDCGVAVFAPLAGRIGRVVAVQVAGRDGPAVSPAVELTDVSAPQALGPLAPVFDWHKAQAETLADRIADGGLTTHRPHCAPLARWVRRAREKGCRTLIANVMEYQPFVTADHRLLAEHGSSVVRGLAIIAKAVGIDDVIIAVDHRRTDAYRALVATAASYRISRVALEHKYPTGSDTILVKVLCRREVPIGGGVMDAGAAVTDAATCFAVYRWVVCERPPTGRAVTVAGRRIAEPANVWAPFGLACRELAGSAEPPVVHGGPMVGFQCGPDVVVGPGTGAVLAIDMPPFQAPAPCIRCGWCADHCPARLNVAALNDAFELGEIDRAERLGAPACVGCGVCTYVCPARLPLTQRVKEINRTIFAGRKGRRPPAEDQEARTA